MCLTISLSLPTQGEYRTPQIIDGATEVVAPRVGKILHLRQAQRRRCCCRSLHEGNTIASIIVIAGDKLSLPARGKFWHSSKLGIDDTVVAPHTGEILSHLRTAAAFEVITPRVGDSRWSAPRSTACGYRSPAWGIKLRFFRWSM